MNNIPEARGKTTEKDRAEQAVIDFSNPLAWPENDSQRPFELARRLQGAGMPKDKPQLCEKHVRKYCFLSGDNFDDFYEEFLHGFDKVKFPEDGIDSLAWSHEMATAEPIPLTTPPQTRVQAIIGSMAWYLAVKVAPHPFFLDRKRIAQLLGVTPMTVSRAVSWLVKVGIVEPVKDAIKVKTEDSATGEQREAFVDYIPGRVCKRYYLKS